MKSNLNLSLLALTLLFASCVSAPKEPVNSPPVAIFQKRPAYPVELFQRDIIERAVVEVEFTVTTAGDVVEPRVVSICRPEYARVVIPCVLTWKFRPKMRNGIPESTRMRVPIQFTAEEVQKKPNKAPEPTPVSVTPRASEGESK